MNKSENEAVARVLVSLRRLFDAETESIQVARKKAIPELLNRRDNVQTMIRELDALVEANHG